MSDEAALPFGLPHARGVPYLCRLDRLLSFMRLPCSRTSTAYKGGSAFDRNGARYTVASLTLSPPLVTPVAFKVSSLLRRRSLPFDGKQKQHLLHEHCALPVKRRVPAQQLPRRVDRSVAKRGGWEDQRRASVTTAEDAKRNSRRVARFLLFAPACQAARRTEAFTTCRLQFKP